jgi:O-acetyl-ADP-ribose deacetylase (regulator of RNase III)
MIHPDYKEYADGLDAFKARLQAAAKDKMSFFNKMMEEKRMSNSKLKHTKGNLLDLAEAGKFDIVVQGCNCFNAMGGGIAREIRERYPHVSEVDSKTDRGDYNKLGDWTSEVVIIKNGTIVFDIINAYTQYNMSTGEDVFEYVAFQLILQKLAHRYPNGKFGFPYIGMGLANGDKNIILEMLDDFATKVHNTGGSVTLVEFA